MASTTRRLLHRLRTGQLTRTEVAGGLAATILGAFAGLQLGNALGSPLAQHFWGGGVELPLSPGMRAASAGAWAVLLLMARTLVDAAGLTARRVLPGRWLPGASWAIAAYMVLNTLGNAASSSDLERLAFTPLTALTAVCAAIVARGARRAREAHGTHGSV